MERERQKAIETHNSEVFERGRAALSRSYMSVDREYLQQAFTMAHRCAVSEDTPDRERKYFRTVAHLLWKACGSEESGVKDPAASGPEAA